jgi:hypothetical protein
MQLVSKFNIWITILMKLALYKYLTNEIVGEKWLQDEKKGPKAKVILKITLIC